MKYVGDRGHSSAASSVIPAAQSLFRQTLLTHLPEALDGLDALARARLLQEAHVRTYALPLFVP